MIFQRMLLLLGLIGNRIIHFQYMPCDTRPAATLYYKLVA